MMGSSWRCLTAQVAAVVFAIPGAKSEVAWSAKFPAADSDGRSAAFAIGDGRHVVAVALSGAQAEAGRLMSDGRELPAEVFVDEVSRLVIFRMSGPPGTALPLVAAPAIPPGAVLKVGGGTATIAGTAKRIEGKILPLALLRVEYSAGAPMPGTPLLNANGAVAAVAHQATGPRSGYALPAEVVRRALECVQGAGRINRGWIGLKLRPDAAVPQVTQVQEGSPAAKAGVVPGDLLLEVGLRRLVDYADAVNAFYFLRPGVVTAVRLRRGNQEFQVSLTPVERAGE
jgi:S1-C subfamily serine protease